MSQFQTEYTGNPTDLLAPLSASPIVETGPVVIPAVKQTQPALPALDELLILASEVLPAQSYGELPQRIQLPVDTPAGVSPGLAGRGAHVREGLRNAIGQYIRTEADLQWCLRVLAAHAVNSMLGNRHRALINQESTKAQAAKQYDTSAVLAAIQGEAVALEAAKQLSASEFELIIQHVRDGHVRIAQNLAGADVDVAALAAGHGKDWRALASEWADKTSGRGTATFSVKTGAAGNVSGASDAGTVSYLLDVLPADGWVLSQWNDGAWTPVQASPSATERAGAARAAVSATRRQSAKPVLPIRGVFPDELVGFA